MAKYWINVRDAKKDFPHDAKCVAFHGTLREARAYAYECECYSWRTNHVIIMQEMPDYSLEIIEEYDV